MNAPPPTLPPGSIVDSYRRDSGGPKQDQSTEQQLNVIEEFCQKYGLVHRHRFVDKAKSGKSTAERDDFNRMLEMYTDSANHPNGLIIWSYARFSRDLNDSIMHKAIIRTKNIVIHSLIDNVPDGIWGRAVEFLIDLTNEEKRIQASVEARRGLRDLVKNHKCVPGIPPRGFMRVPMKLGKRDNGSDHIAHRWEPDPKLKARVRKAFKMKAAHISVAQIMKATRLFNAESSYTTFFSNKIYIGILEYGGEIYEDYCKPIVDLETWNQVQKLVREHSEKKFKDRHPRRANSVYLLSGLVKCYDCGAPLNGNTVTREKRIGRDEAYRCANAKNRGGCHASRIPASWLEKAVIDTIIQYILLPEALAAHQFIAHENEATGEKIREDRYVTLIQERGELARQITNLAKAIAETGHSSALLDALKQKEVHRAQVKSELEQLDIPRQSVPLLSQPQLETASKALIQLLTASPPEERRQLLRGLIQEVRVIKSDHHLKGEISYFYPPPFELAPMLLIERATVGALLYRQRFTQPFEAYEKPHSY